MRSYPYDDILQRHLQNSTKVAFWGAAFRAAVPMIGNAVRAAGPAIGNAVRGAGTALSRANTAVTPFVNAAQTANTARGVLQSANQPNQPNQPRPPTTASLREKSAAVYRFKGADWKHHAAHAAPYVGWLASQAADATGHHRLAKGLSAASYLGYAGSALHDAITNPKERITGAVDAAALLAMLASDAKRWRSNDPPT